MVRNKIKKAVYIEKRDLRKIEEAMKKDDTVIFSEFVNRAVDFYIGFLNTENSADYLLPTIRATLLGLYSGLEDQIGNLVLHDSVNVVTMQLILNDLLNGAEYPEEKWQQYHKKAEGIVKEDMNKKRRGIY